MRLVLSRHGIWYYRKCYTLASGKRKEIRKSLGTRCKRDAKLLASHIDSASYASNLSALTNSIIIQDKIPPLAACIDSYLVQNSHLWQERHRQRLQSVLNELPRLHLDKADVSQLKNKWLKDKSIATVNKCLGYCSMFYKWLQTEYDGIANPFDRMRLKGHQEQSRKPYTPSELSKFQELANALRMDGKDSHFWFLMLGRYTGMRAGEVCQLKVVDVDTKKCIFYVRGEQLKTKHSNRAVPIHSNLIQQGLFEFVGTRKERLMEHWKPSKRSYAAMPTKWYSNFRSRHGLPDYHSLRHTVATELKTAGVPAQYCAAILGHANGNITFDRYGHDVAIEKLHEAMALVGEVI